MAKEKVTKEEVVWDRKKIAIFLISLFLFFALIFELKTLILPKETSVQNQKTKSSKTVEGTSTDNLPDLRQGVQNQIDNLKQEAQNINVVDIASSSPQVQKVINDLKSLQNLPQNQVKGACEKICGSL